MKQFKLFFISVGFVVIFTACSKEPMDVAYIINYTDKAVMWYSDIDSLPILPYQKVYCGTIIVEDDKITSWGDYYRFKFEADRTLTKLGIMENDVYTIYDVPLQYQSILHDIKNYLHHFSISNDKYISSHYEFYLSEKFIQQIINPDAPQSK